MVIREFGAVHFRNYGELFVSFSDRINLLIGDNGQGKTNLAEGIHVLCHLSSFRTHRIDPLLAFGEPQAWLQGTVIKDDTEIRAKVELSRRGRRAWIDEQPIPTLSHYVSRFYAVLFNPDSLYSFRHYPATRRGEFDRFLSFLARDYLEAARDYRNVLSQKNSLLKQGELGSLPEWNRLLLSKASDMIRGRVGLVQELNARLPALFARLTGREQPLELRYLPSLSGDAEQDAHTLERALEAERHAGHALHGPHRDDFEFVLDGRRKESHLSQGEYRISLLALKLAFNETLRERLSFRPVIVLDDLFSELDATVQEQLVAYLAAIPNQVFITTTHPPAALREPAAHIMEIRSGRIA